MAKTERNWSEVGSSGVEFKFDELPFDSEGLVGFYKGSRTVATDDPNNPGEKRNSLLHDFQLEADQSDVFVWGSWDLDDKLGQIPSGALVKVEFMGKETIKGGKQTIKRYRVSVTE